MKSLKKINPSKSEIKKDSKILGEVFDLLKSATPPNIQVVLVGSVAKGTQLKNKKDFDVFLLFPKKYSKKELEELGFKYAKKAFERHKYRKAYAEHPYLKVKYKGYDIDVVPAYKIKEITEKGTAVDRSPLHSEYINSHLSAKQKDDVRLLKQFMKANNIYGAEIRVEGFSGYLCELLIAKYGSIVNLFNEAQNWSIPMYIDIEAYYKKEEMDKLKSLFSNAPLIVIDPVDKNRNVSAVVSSTSLSIFIFSCRQFLKKPSTNFFIKQKYKITKTQLKRIIDKRQTEILVIKFKAPDLVEDTLWPQLRKTAVALKNYFRKQGFEKFGYYYWSDEKECIIMFEFLIPKLPGIIKCMGPRITQNQNVEDFIKSHSHALDIHIEHDYICAIESRQICNVKDAFKEALRSNIGIPINFMSFIKKAKILKKSNLIDEKYKDITTEYFTRTIK
ncbi:CCA tRNA nucleotidyltransferase [Candidatus Micrarchaeota archaeon]|nr:CCA tRNA nucleotidyltransferase [Candidatus Micrarchaeota archaeon]